MVIICKSVDSKSNLKIAYEIWKKDLIGKTWDMWRHLGKPSKTVSNQTPGVLHGVWSEPGLIVTYKSYANLFFRFLYTFKIIYRYKYMENADLEKHCLLLHKPGLNYDVTYIILLHVLLRMSVCIYLECLLQSTSSLIYVHDPLCLMTI